jgi:hypothetical protein
VLLSVAHREREETFLDPPKVCATEAMGALPRLDESFPRQYEAHAKGERWTGVFGEDSSGLQTGLFTTPDDGSLCGYFVEAANPISWFRVESTPIRLVLPFPPHRLLVFGNFTEFVAYRFASESIDVRLHVAWRSARLGWDDLEVSRVTHDRIEGRAWHAPDDRMMGFSLDVQTGEHEGGAYAPHID